MAPSPVQKAAQKADSCQILRSEFKPAAVDRTAEPITQKVQRQFQRVVRYDCAQNVTSDKIETVQSPTFQFDLVLPEPRHFESVFVFNETSCDHKLTRMPQADPFLIGNLFSITGDGSKVVSVKGDIAQAVFTFNMNPGPNAMYVRYYDDCMPDQVSGNEHAVVSDDKVKRCGPEAKFRTVLFPVTVEYSEVTLEGRKDLYMSAEACKAKPQ